MNTSKIIPITLLMVILSLMAVACSPLTYPQDFDEPRHAVDLVKALDNDDKANPYRWKEHVGNTVTVYGVIIGIVSEDYASSRYYVEIGDPRKSHPGVGCWMPYDQIVDLDIKQFIAVTGRINKWENSESKVRYILDGCLVNHEYTITPDAT